MPFLHGLHNRYRAGVLWTKGVGQYIEWNAGPVAFRQNFHLKGRGACWKLAGDYAPLTNAVEISMRHRPQSTSSEPVVAIEMRGRVQGAGFRPTVWRYPRELGLADEVLNHSAGAPVGGRRMAIAEFMHRAEAEPPPLARIDQIEMARSFKVLSDGLRIADSAGGAVHREGTPDATICREWAQGIVAPFARRYRYPFANCTHCGPRVSIVNGIAYDRVSIPMSPPFVALAKQRSAPRFWSALATSGSEVDVDIGTVGRLTSVCGEILREGRAG
jgi:acylphosphatase